MGVVTDIVNQIDQSAEKRKELGETLDLLVSLAEAKAEHCQKIIEEDLKLGRVAGNDALFFPITDIAEKRVQYRCTTTDTPDDLIPTITDSITRIFKDHTAENIINGISTTVNEYLKALLSADEGTEQYSQIYTTEIDGGGITMSFVRTDFMFWCRKISASSLKSEMDSILTCVAYKSVIDVPKLKFGDFQNIYTKIIDKGIPDTISPEERKEIIVDRLQEAREIFEMLGGKLENNLRNNSLEPDLESPLELGIIYKDKKIR